MERMLAMVRQYAAHATRRNTSFNEQVIYFVRGFVETFRSQEGRDLTEQEMEELRATIRREYRYDPSVADAEFGP